MICNFKKLETLFEEKHNNIKISINEIEGLGKALYIDDVLAYGENDNRSYDEMLVHTAMCTHNNPKNILLLGYVAGGTLNELLKYKDIKIDLVEDNSLLLDLGERYFDFKKIKDNNNVNIIEKNQLEYIKTAKELQYDVIIINTLDKDEDKYYHLSRISKQDSLFTSIAPALWLNDDKMKKVLKSAGMFFKISMPYKYESYCKQGFISNFVMCSKKYHPTADIILQRADFLENLNYYNCDIHKSSFTLPQYQISELRGFSKN